MSRSAERRSDAAGGRSPWPGQEVAEFLGAVSAHTSPVEAARHGVERVAEMLEAEAAAIVRPGFPVISAGFPAGRVPEAELLEMARRPVGHTELPGLGGCAVVREPLDQERLEWLIVARTGRPITARERDLLRGLARVLGVAREMIGRRRLLERVSAIQRQIVRRAPPAEVLRAIVEGAAAITGSEIAVIRQIDPEHEDRTHVGASVGLGEGTLATLRTAEDRDGLNQIARRENRLVVSESYQSSVHANPLIRAADVQAAMAAPVHEGAVVVGSLSVGCRGIDRRYRASERAALETFAEYASLALTDARLVADAVHRAMHDALTELPNRALFSDRLAQSLARCERADEHVAVLFLDIDRFKTVNDSLGHTAGDELLVAAAHRLRAAIRPGDTAARLGGDEFAVLVEHADEGFGRIVGERILAAFAEPFAIGGRTVHLGASIGIAVAGRPEEDPLRDGDLAMYQAKAQGRGRCAVFRPAMRRAARERLELESELHGASVRGEMFLEYQPIVSLGDERPQMVEALVRWSHPTRGRLAPGAFLPLAEETREIADLGRWVIRAACDQARAWQRARLDPDLAVSVNLSPTQLHTTQIVEDVRVALAESGLAPDRLVLELTETVITLDVASAAERLRGLSRLGVSLAIDDFGTGYCSLQYLQRFPFNYLKIAPPFVADIESPDADLSLIRAIADLGDSCGLTVVAEGIETSRQWRHLLEVGCTLGQGYLLGRPQAPDALRSRLAVG